MYYVQLAIEVLLIFTALTAVFGVGWLGGCLIFGPFVSPSQTKRDIKMMLMCLVIMYIAGGLYIYIDKVWRVFA